MTFRAPFNRIFQLFYLFGLYGVQSVKVKIFKFLQFFICAVLGATLSLLALYQVKNGTETISILTFAPVLILTQIYTIYFLANREDIVKFLKKMERLDQENSSAKPYMDKAYKLSEKLNKIIMVYLLLPMFIANPIYPMITGRTNFLFWYPNFMSEDDKFYFTQIYETLIFFHTGTIFVNLIELMVQPLIIINGYSKYCEDQLGKLSHKSKSGETSIKACAKIYGNLIQLQTEYNKLFPFLFMFQSFVFTYTNCTVTMLLTLKVVLLQIYYFCIYL
jgi:hypothetical protein